MLKLLVMLVAFLLVALTLLGLRQHRLELTSQSAAIYQQIRERNESLLDQRVTIARKTNPWALDAALKEQGVNTGAALQKRITQATPKTPQVETDLVAPLLEGHSPSRPR